MRARRARPRFRLACLAALLASLLAPGVGVGPRHRGPRRPADPGLAVRLDRDGGDGDLVPRAVEPVVKAPACSAPRAGCCCGSRSCSNGCAARRDRAVRDRRLRGPRGRTEPHLEPRPHLHLRDLLGRHPDRERVRRRHLPAVEPVARARAADGLAARAAPATGADRCSAPIPPRWGRWPAAATLLAFAWLELVLPEQGRPTAARDPDARLRRRAAGGDGGVRRGDVGASGPTGSASTSG